MAAAVYATSDDVATALVRPLTTTEAQYVPGLLAKASGMLRTAMPTVDARLAASGPTALDPTVVASVVAGVVKRYLVNPSGAATDSETVGPMSHSTSYASYGKALGGNGELQILPDDLARLAPAPGFTTPGTIRLRPPPQPCTGVRW